MKRSSHIFDFRELLFGAKQYEMYDEVASELYGRKRTGCVVHNVLLTLQGKRLNDFAECRAFALNSGGNTDICSP